jgi:hypothetical protein
VSPLLALRNLSSAAEPELAGWLSLSECRTLSRDGPESLFSPVPLVVVAIVLLEWSTALLSAGRLVLFCSRCHFRLAGPTRQPR